MLLALQKRDSSPGHPWVTLGKTKGHIIDDHSEMLISTTLDLIDVWVSGNEPPDDPMALVRLGWNAPIRVFVKNEPHSLAKLESGRVRIIASVPFHVVLAEQLLFFDQNECEISQWLSCPSKPGISLSSGESVRKFYDNHQDQLKKGTLGSNDMSGYDWSLSEAFFQAEAQMRIDLAGGQGTTFERAVRNCFFVMARCVIALSDGRMFAQVRPGIMWSGRYVTSSSDSRIRVLVSSLTGASWCESMGDDAIEEYRSNAVDLYARLGLRCTDNRQCDEDSGFEFCSHLFKEGKAWTVNPGKILVNLLSQPKPTSDLWAQFLLETRTYPLQSELVDIVERSGWGAQINTNNDGKEIRSETPSRA